MTRMVSGCFWPMILQTPQFVTAKLCTDNLTLDKVVVQKDIKSLRGHSGMVSGLALM